MRRRRASGDDLDSLNLLLDTVCNMFGVFIFSALIVAVMSLTRTTQIVESQSAPPIAAPDDPALSAARASVDELNSRLDRLRTSRGRVLSERAKEASSRRDAAERELADRVRARDQYRQATEDSQMFIAGLDQAIPALRDDLAKLEDALRRARSIKEVEARTPLRRALEGRVPVQLVLHDDRAFVINPWWDHLGTADHPCDIWSHWNEQAVDGQRSECVVVRCLRGGDVEIHRRVALREEGGGIPAKDADALAADPRWLSFLSSLDPRRHVVTIRCSPTGFRAFGPVRGSIVGRGIPYNADPVRLDPFYRDSIVEGTPIGQ
jgi:hypothetical protein